MRDVRDGGLLRVGGTWYGVDFGIQGKGSGSVGAGRGFQANCCIQEPARGLTCPVYGNGRDLEGGRKKHNFKPQILNPKPSTLDLKPQTQSPKPLTPDHKLKTSNPKPQNPEPQTPDPLPQPPKPETQTPNTKPNPEAPNPKPQTQIPKSQTSNPKSRISHPKP